MEPVTDIGQASYVGIRGESEFLVLLGPPFMDLGIAGENALEPFPLDLDALPLRYEG